MTFDVSLSTKPGISLMVFLEPGGGAFRGRQAWRHNPACTPGGGTYPASLLHGKTEVRCAVPSGKSVSALPTGSSQN